MYYRTLCTESLLRVFFFFFFFYLMTLLDTKSDAILQESVMLASGAPHLHYNSANLAKEYTGRTGYVTCMISVEFNLMAHKFCFHRQQNPPEILNSTPVSNKT